MSFKFPPPAPWKIFVDSPKSKNINKIHPLKQKEVEDFVIAASQVDNIKRVTIFGSSVDHDCNPWSDLDIYIETAGPVNTRDIKYTRSHDYVKDIWYDFNLTDCDCEDLLNEITSKGVIVYERNPIG